jgi:glutathione S-transferase
VSWTAVTLGTALRQIFVTDESWAPEELQHEKLNIRARHRFREPLMILGDHLDGRDYIAADTFTLADIFCSADLTWAVGAVGEDISNAPHLEAWLKRCTSRECPRVEPRLCDFRSADAVQRLR